MQIQLFNPRSILFAAISLLALGSMVFAAGPGTPEKGIPYQGRLEQNGAPLSATDVAILFRIYDGDVDDGAAAELWSDTFAVDVTAGNFHVVLGQGGVSLPQAVFDAAELWVEAEVDGFALNGRNQVWAMPQVTRAAQSDLADHATTADLAFNADVATLANAAESAAGGNFEVSSGRIWRGADPGGTSDLGLYSGVVGNFIRIVTNGSQTVFYNDGGRGSSADVTITEDRMTAHNDFTVVGAASFNNPIRLPIGAGVSTGSDTGAEVYMSSASTCTRGQLQVFRPSSASTQDSLCYCGIIDDVRRWVCYNP